MQSITSFVGMDVSKDYLDVQVLDGEAWGSTSDDKGRAQLLRRLPAPGTCLVAVEATGGYERAIVADLLNAGHLVALVNPRQVRDFAKGLGKLAKTDRIDASVLAKFAATVKPRVITESSEKRAELEELVVRRRQVLELLQAEKNRQRHPRNRLVRESVARTVKVLKDELRQIEAEIAKLIKTDDEWRQKAEVLRSVPGVGEVAASTLIAELPELGEMSRQEVAALVGVAPMNHDSGRFRGQRRIRGGRAVLRSALHMVAVASTIHNPVIKAFQSRLRAQGKPYKVATTACLRKLLVILNAMLKTNTKWSPQLAAT